MNKLSKIYIAGHTGLIGSALLKQLQKDGYKNLVFKNHSELELTNNYDVKNFFKKEKPDIVFVASGRAGNLHMCISNPASLFLINSLTQNNIFSASIEYGVKNLVYFSSSCVYPENTQQPIDENSLLSGPLEKATIGYAAAKLSGLLTCQSINKEFFNGNCNYITIIPNTAYGPNDHFDLVNSHVFSALVTKFFDAKKNNINKITLMGSGKPKREFVFSDDIADAAIFLVNNFESLSNTHYNVGIGIETSIRVLAKKITEYIGYKGEIFWDKSKPDGRDSKLLNSFKINELGWKHRIDLDMGIKLTVDWYKENYGKINSK